MKILKQFGVIFGVCWISLVIEHYLPFSFPASDGSFTDLSADRIFKDRACTGESRFSAE